jgi:hypothetical protein
VSATSLNEVPVWLEGDTAPTRTISSGLNSPFNVFVTINGDVYVDNGLYNGQVDKWTSNASNSVIAMYVSDSCSGLFVDIYDNLYCSMGSNNTVIKRSFNDNVNTSTIVGGNGIAGSSSYMQQNPAFPVRAIKCNDSSRKWSTRYNFSEQSSRTCA